METVTRYVATYVNADGQRTLMCPAQGRNTYASAAEAQAWIDAVTRNNTADTIRQVWGDNPRFEVRPCPCWPGHFDPQTVWFEETARKVDAYDLELFAINTGQFYETHKRFAEADAYKPDLSAWQSHVRNRVLARYSREVEPVTADDATVTAVAVALQEYYRRHREESKAEG